MGLMPPQDSMFLVPESREQPMHVGGLQVFELPEGADDGFVSELYEQALAVEEVSPLFRKRPRRSLTTLGQWAWEEDDDLDLEHHVRHSALPRPGRVRELLALVSRLHGTLLDRKRPLWEAHLIEGLEGGRFAVYTKTHHAMIDGISGMRLLQRSMSTDPDAVVPMPYAMRTQGGRRRGGGGGVTALPGQAARGAVRVGVDAVTITPALVKIAEKVLRQQRLALPGQAPRTILNTSISGSRRFAADGWDLSRIRAVGKAAGATVNDVVLAMCSGALRQYLLDLDALPDAPLIAMTPVNLRADDPDDDRTGNAVGIILCNLATDLEDAGERLAAVRESMLHGKDVLSGLDQLQITALSALALTPIGLNAFLPLHKLTNAYNLVISNVPGPADTLYFNGARLQGLYPLSIPTHGQALNVTVTSYAGQLQFGLTGDRKALPSLQRLLVHLEDSLAALERAVA
ncbi:MAG TPA: wax ester/triacylglycerol synthase family O-acyltransferase [Mycobacteriales bacterium]|nr:wax ester/triacylglycerol synthase family O-acyltransferase [Mycobacteriales bacterium]